MIPSDHNASHENSKHFVSVTEIAGDEVSQEQVFRLCNRYFWASQFCKEKDVLEVACGTGQGLGLLAQQAKSVSAGDICPELVERAQKHYGDRIRVDVIDALSLPYEQQELDVVLMFEALYYLKSIDIFFQECRRVLRPGGRLLISTANCDLFDFNRSPYSVEYLGVRALTERLEKYGFTVEMFGSTPVDELSLKQRVLRPVKQFAVKHDLIPKSMAGKKLLKRFVFGSLVPMQPEIDWGDAEVETLTPLDPQKADHKHKVILCSAQLQSSN